MSYLGSWAIDDALTFYANTTRFDTGAATDADAVPSYRVYEDETGTALLNGNMALLDSSNTAGFYSEQITLSAANGFEAGKQYAIYIAATVNSVAGATHHTFQVGAKVNTTHLAGTAQTARDIGASVLLSNGTGTGQVKLASGYLAMTWADIGAPTTTVNLSGTTIKAVTDAVALPASATIAITGNITGNLSGSVGSVTGNVGGNVAGSVGSVTGAVGSVTGAVGSVTGNVGGNVTGSVGSVADVSNIVSEAITVSGGIASADIKKVNDVTVDGDGQPGTEWGPA